MSKDSHDQIFKSLSLPGEIKSLIQSLILHQTEILCKLPEEKLIKVQVVRQEKNDLLVRPQGLEFSFQNNSEVICSLTLAGEKHYFVSQLNKKNGAELLIRIPDKFFVLQRRQNYRLKIPESYQALIFIKLSPHGQIQGHLHDLSVGGCRASFDLSEISFQLEQEVQGKLQIKGRDPIEFQGLIRHIQGSTIGFEFIPFTPALESRVFALTMDLHKEFFSHLK